MPELVQLLAAMHTALDGLSEHVSDSGRFELRVLLRALEIVQREVAQGAAARELEQHSLASLLGRPGSLDDLNAELCARLQDGAQQPDDPELLRVLRACVQARLAIDNPDFE
jgi:hypothetical protein